MLQIQNAGRLLIYLANGEKQNLEFHKVQFLVFYFLISFLLTYFAS